MSATGQHDVIESLAARLHRASQEIEKLYHAAAGQQAPTLRQLTVLAATRGWPSQIELARKTGIDRSTLSVIVQLLERRGLLRRARSKTDTRAVKVSITLKGMGVLDTYGKLLSRIEAEAATAHPAAWELVMAVGGALHDVRNRALLLSTKEAEPKRAKRRSKAA